MPTTRPSDEAARHAQLVSRTLLESIQDGVYTLDRAGRFTFVNDFIARNSGYPVEAFLGRSYLELIRPEDRDRVEANFKVVLAGKTVPAYELAYRTVAGEEIWVEVNTAPLIHDGVIVGVLGVSRNIHKRRLADAALREAEEKYRSLVESLPHGVCIVRKQRIVFANPALLRMLRVYSTEELSQFDLFEFIAPDARGVLRDRLQRRLAGEAGLPNGYVVPVVRPDDSGFHAEVYVEAMQHQGKLAAQVVVIDVDERLRLETHLRQTQKLEALGALAGGVAHDFNNLLTGIMGMASLLSRGRRGDAETVRIASLIESAADKATSLTRQLLDFSRRDEPRFELVDVHEVIGEVVSILRHTIDKRIALDVLLRADDAIVNADQAQLQQVLMNLAVNARDVMPKGGTLTIETANVEVSDAASASDRGADSASQLQVIVRDTGPGISTEDAERIFEPFFTTKPRGEGCGMGLAVAHGIARSHGGALRLVHRPGAGATFVVELPVLGGQAVRPRTKAESELSGHGTILVVDDQSTVRNATGELLRELGYQVLTSPHAHDAIEVFEQRRDSIDVVLLDVNMPDTSGLECAERLTEIDAGVRIVLMSGFGAGPAIRRLVELGTVDYIDKPYTIHTLSTAIVKAQTRRPLTSTATRE